MEYKGELYGKVPGGYIPLEETAADVDALRARAEKAEAWSAEIRQAAHALLEVLPSCRCREAYTERFLVDPDCEAHDFEPEADRLRAILAGKGE